MGKKGAGAPKDPGPVGATRPAATDGPGAGEGPHPRPPPPSSPSCSQPAHRALHSWPSSRPPPRRPGPAWSSRALRSGSSFAREQHDAVAAVHTAVGRLSLRRRLVALGRLASSVLGRQRYCGAPLRSRPPTRTGSTTGAPASVGTYFGVVSVRQACWPEPVPKIGPRRGLLYDSAAEDLREFVDDRVYSELGRLGRVISQQRRPHNTRRLLFSPP